MPESLNHKMPIRHRICYLQLHCIFCQPPADQRLKFHWAQFSPFPLSLLGSLLNVCALVQIFYCFLCTSQNSLSLAEHNCAPVRISSHWLLRFRALVVNYSIWMTWHWARSIRQKFPKIPVQNRMEQKISGKSFRKFRSAFRGCPFFRKFRKFSIPYDSSSRHDSSLVPLAVTVASTNLR